MIEFQFWGLPRGTTIEDGVNILGKNIPQDARSKIIKVLDVHGRRASSVGFLIKDRRIEKVEGNNPDKVHKMKISSVSGRLRIYLLILHDKCCLLLHLLLKKSKRADGDIDLAKKRAAQFKEMIK